MTESEMITRIEAAERRADLNIHQATQDRDNAILSLKASLSGLLQAQLADVPDSLAGMTFSSVDEEVLMTRLVAIRKILLSQGIAS